MTPTLIPEFEALAKLPVGQYRCKRWWELWKWNAGWITVEKEDDRISVWWMTGKNSHCAIFGNAVCVDVSPDGQLVAFFKSALSLWLKWGYGRGTQKEYAEARWWAKWMVNKVEEAK